MAAFTITSTPLSSVLPPTSGHPSDVAEEQRRLFTAVLRRDVPGQSTQDRYTQARSYLGAQYIAIQRVMKGVAAGSIRIMKRRPDAASHIYTVNDAKVSKDWEPAPGSHHLSWLFRTINPQDTLMGFLSQYVMARCLHGVAYIYAPPGRGGKPVELWSIPPQYVSPLHGMSLDYPFGAWRVQLPQPNMYGWGAAGQVVVDARHMIEERTPNPVNPWDGFSPLAAGALQIDTLQTVNEARKNTLERGPSVDTIVSISGASTAELQRQKAEHEQKYQGVHKGARVMFTNGQDVKATATGITPKEMEFKDGYEQLTNFSLALFGVPHPVAGLTDTGSFAQLYAAIQQFRELTLQPMVSEIAAHLTKHLVHKYWGEDYCLCIELPVLTNPEIENQNTQTYANMGVYTLNDTLRRLGQDAKPDGDVPVSIYLAKLQQAMAPQPGAEDAGGMPGQEGTGEDAGPTEPGQQESLDAATEALGGGAEEPVVKSMRIHKAGWTRATTKSGHTAATNSISGRTIYGADAERVLSRTPRQAKPDAGTKTPDANHPDVEHARKIIEGMGRELDEHKARLGALLDKLGAKPESWGDPKAWAGGAAKKAAPAIAAKHGVSTGVAEQLFLSVLGHLVGIVSKNAKKIVQRHADNRMKERATAEKTAAEKTTAEKPSASPIPVVHPAKSPPRPANPAGQGSLGPRKPPVLKPAKDKPILAKPPAPKDRRHNPDLDDVFKKSLTDPQSYFATLLDEETGS